MHRLLYGSPSHLFVHQALAYLIPIIRLKVPIGVYTWEKHQNLQERLLSSYFEDNGTPLGRIKGQDEAEDHEMLP